MAAEVSIFVNAITGRAVSEFKKLGSSIDASTQKAEKLGTRLRKGFNIGAGVAGAAGMAGATFAVNAAMNLNQELIKSFTILEKQGDRDKIVKDIERISKATGVAQAELAKGGFNIISADQFKNFDPLLEASAKLAVATTSNASDLTSGISTAANIFKMKAGDIADGFFMMNNAAQAELPDIAKMVGRVGASFMLVGKQGRQFQEMAGLFSALTIGGADPAEATTGMASIMKLATDEGFAKRSKKQFGERISPSQGIEEFVGKLASISLDELSALVTDDTARQALMKLTNDTNKLSELMRKNENAVGSVAKAMDIIANESSYKFNLAMNQLNISMVTIGNQLMPLVTNNLIPNFVKGIESATPVLMSLAGSLGHVLRGLGLMAETSTVLLGGEKGPQLKQLNSMNEDIRRLNEESRAYRKVYGDPRDSVTPQQIKILSDIARNTSQ